MPTNKLKAGISVNTSFRHFIYNSIPRRTERRTRCPGHHKGSGQRVLLSAAFRPSQSNYRSTAAWIQLNRIQYCHESYIQVLEPPLTFAFLVSPSSTLYEGAYATWQFDQSYDRTLKNQKYLTLQAFLLLVLYIFIIFCMFFVFPMQTDWNHDPKN